MPPQPPQLPPRPGQPSKPSTPASNRSSANYPKSPVDLYQIRRVVLREQKRQLIVRKLDETLPIVYLLIHSGLLLVISLAIIGVQIALIVYKSPLYYICNGFWTAAIYFISIFVLFLLAKHRTYKLLMISLLLHGLGFAASLGGLIILNIFSLAMYNTSCLNTTCGIGSHQYLNLIILIFGVLGLLVCAAYVFLIDFLILKEARSLNVYLNTTTNNRNARK